MGCQLVHRHQNLYSQPLICLCVRWQQGDVPASAKIWLLGHRAIQLHQMLTRTALLTLALARLYEPSLTASQRTGTLPMVAWANLSAMTSFSISNNNMTGTLPSQLAAAWPKLAVLSVNQNRFEGKAHAHMQRAASVWSVWLTLWQGKHGAADAQKICRHPPTCLVHTTAADARRELQQHCGCVLCLGAQGVAWQLHCRCKCPSCHTGTLPPACGALLCLSSFKAGGNSLTRTYTHICFAAAHHLHEHHMARMKR